MLTKEENHLNFLCIKMLSLLNLIPLELDLTTGLISKQKSPWRRWAWKLNYLSSILYWLYISGRLFQTLLIPGYYIPGHFPDHLLFVVTLTFSNLMACKLFIINIDDCVIVFNELFVNDLGLDEYPLRKLGKAAKIETKPRPTQGKVIEKKDQVKLRRVQPQQQLQRIEQNMDGQDEDENEDEIMMTDMVHPKRGWSDYSRQELLMLTQTQTIYGGEIFPGILGLALDKTRLQLLYSMLPLAYQGSLSFYTLLSFESLFFTMALGGWGFYCIMAGLFFLKCDQVAEKMNAYLRTIQPGAVTSRTMQRVMTILRTRIIYIKLINDCCADIIFRHKMANLTVGIVLTFAGIQNLESNPVLAATNLCVGSLYQVFYCVMFERAFRIPEELERVKENVQLSLATEMNALWEKKWLLKSVQAIPKQGIKVGGFRTLERESTPIFIYFVMQQVASLLLSARSRGRQ